MVNIYRPIVNDNIKHTVTNFKATAVTIIIILVLFFYLQERGSCRPQQIPFISSRVNNTHGLLRFIKHMYYNSFLKNII